MNSLCGYGGYIIPASTLLSRKLNRTAVLTLRYSRHIPVDQQLAQCCKRKFRIFCAVAVAEQSNDVAHATPAIEKHKPSFRAFLDFKALKVDLDKHVQNCKDRNSSADPTKVASLYDKFCEAQQRVDKGREDRNSNAKAMKVASGTPVSGRGAQTANLRIVVQGKLDPQQRQRLVQQGKALKESLAQMEHQMESLQDSLQHEGQLLPNLAHPSVSTSSCDTIPTHALVGDPCANSVSAFADPWQASTAIQVPVGGEEAAVEVVVVGEQCQFDFDIRYVSAPHL